MTTHLIANLNPPGAGAWQGAVQNVRTGEWFVIHARGSFLGGPAEDVLIYRFDAKHVYKDKMTLIDAGHPYSFGVSNDNVLWVTWDAAGTNDVVTIPYRANDRFTKPVALRAALADKEHAFTDGSAQAGFSADREVAVLAENLGRNRWRFTRRLKADVLAGRDKPLGHKITRKTPVGTWFQGFTTQGHYIYLCFGKVDKKAWIEKWNTDTGKLHATRDITNLGRLKGESSKGIQREPEGLDSIPGGIVVSVKVYTGDKRRLRLFQITDF